MSACENNLMNVYLIEAQFFQMVGPTCSSLDGFGVSSSGSDLPPPPPRTMVEALFTSMVEQTHLGNLLVDHMKENQLNTSDSLLPPSKLPMDLTKEEGKSRSHKRAFPKMDLSEWGNYLKGILSSQGQTK
jgi:hypothetical protein